MRSGSTGRTRRAPSEALSQPRRILKPARRERGDMPYRLWRHVCQGKEVLTGSPDCAACGANGVFDSWRLSAIEAACVYRYVYEFEPLGPHRPLVDRFLAPLRTPCVRCGGLAVLTIDIGTWSACPTCEGTGGVWSRSMEEVETVRRQILAQVTTPRTAQLPGRKRSSRRAQPRRQKGYSSHGLSFADVERAFAEAERILGTSG